MSSRKVTSAIEGMSVAEVRRGLDAVRTQWHQGGGARFYFTEKLFNGMTVQEFCTKFTLGHHTTRHARVPERSVPAGHAGPEEAQENGRPGSAARMKPRPAGLFFLRSGKGAWQT